MAAADHDIVALHHAPEPQQLPVLLLAAVHDLLLRGVGPQLAAHYPNLTSSPVGVIRSRRSAFCRTHGVDIVATIGTRHTQTNEVGRCALFLPALAGVGEAEGPLAHVDVGASAGLNLLLPRFHYRYEPGGSVGGPSPVTLHCATRRGPPIPPAMPTISASIGVDLAQSTSTTTMPCAGWKPACGPTSPTASSGSWPPSPWPAKVGVDVRPGGAVDDAGVVTEAAAAGHPVITTSWVLNYLTGAQRRRFVAELDRLGSTMDLTWVAAESPAETAGLPFPAWSGEERTVLAEARWRAGERTVRRLLHRPPARLLAALDPPPAFMRMIGHPPAIILMKARGQPGSSGSRRASTRRSARPNPASTTTPITRMTTMVAKEPFGVWRTRERTAGGSRIDWVPGMTTSNSPAIRLRHEKAQPCLIPESTVGIAAGTTMSR